MIVKKYYKLVRVSHEDSEYFYFKNTSNTIGNFHMNIVGSAPQTIYLKYSTDGVTWENYDFSTRPDISVNPGANIYFKGNNPDGLIPNLQYGTHGYSFYMDVDHIAGGNICSLIQETNFEQITTLPAACFKFAFQNDVNLTDVTKMNIGNAATVLYNYVWKPGAFERMFEYCNKLENGLDLSSITNITDTANKICLYMYSGCSKLSTATAPNIQDLSTGVLNSWLVNAGTQATGTKTVNVPTGATILTDSVSGIPTGWTRVDY